MFPEGKINYGEMKSGKPLILRVSLISMHHASQVIPEACGGSRKLLSIKARDRLPRMTMNRIEC